MVISGILTALGTQLLAEGVEYIGDVITDGTPDMIKKVSKTVKRKTGVDLLNVGTRGEKLTKEDIAALRKYDVEFAVKEYEHYMEQIEAARSNFNELATAENGTFLTKNAGTIIGLSVVYFTLALDASVVYYVLQTALTNKLEIGQAIDSVNSLVTLILGIYHTILVSIVGFYYGKSKNESDEIKAQRIQSFQTSRDNLTRAAEESRAAQKNKVLIQHEDKVMEFNEKKLSTINKATGFDNPDSFKDLEAFGINAEELAELNELNNDLNSSGKI